MTKSQRTAAKRTVESSSFRPSPAQIDQLHAATRAKSPWFNAAAVKHNLETLLQQTYRRRRARLPPDHLMVEQLVEQRAPSRQRHSGAELCS